MKHIELLGLKAMDKVTNFKGVISSVYYDLYGCIQVCLTPPVDDKGKRPDSIWIDVSRAKVTKTRVMPVPNFGQLSIEKGEHGPCESRPVVD